MDLKKTIIDTLRTIGYTKIMKESITTKVILGMVSANKGVPVSEIKVLVDYKTIIKDEISKMKNEAKTIKKKPIADDMNDIDDIDELPDMRFRDILRPGAGGAPVPIADWLTTKDLENLSTVNKATRESAILELKRKNTILSLNSVKSEKYINNTEYRSHINSILSKYNKKLQLSIYKDQKLFDILWTIPEIEINLQSLELNDLPELIDITPLEKLTNLQSLELKDLGHLTGDIIPIEKLTNLKSLKLHNLYGLTDIKPLEKLTNLQTLELSGLDSLGHIPSIDFYQNRYLGAELKFVWLPQRCIISGKLLWLKYAYRLTAMYTGPGDPVYDYRWHDKNTHIMWLLKR